MLPSDNLVRPEVSSSEPSQIGMSEMNVGETERWLSIAAGSFLALRGLRGFSFGSLLMMLSGGALIFRGVTGHCDVYGKFGLNSRKSRKGHKIEHSVIINRSAEDLFKFWRNFENLPRIMSHIENVRVLDESRSHWSAKTAGLPVDWYARIINEHPNEMICWESVEGSQIHTAGCVRFTSLQNGTEVRVIMEYTPPLGQVGTSIMRAFGSDPSRSVSEDLQEFKEMMEAEQHREEPVPSLNI